MKIMNNPDRSLTHAQNINNKSGSLLIEILVSTMIIAMMMSTLFGFVSFAGEIWRKTHSSVNLMNEGNMLMDTIERELNVALLVTSPAVAADVPALVYQKTISDYNGTFGHDGVFKISFDGPTRTVSLSIFSAPTTDGGWTIATVDGINKANSYYYNYDISKHVKSLSFNRTSERLMIITAVLAVKSENGKIDKEIVLKRNIIMTSL